MYSSFSIPSRINPRIWNPRFLRHSCSTARCYVSLKSDSRWNKKFFTFRFVCYFLFPLSYFLSYFTGLNMQSVGGLFSLPRLYSLLPSQPYTVKNSAPVLTLPQHLLGIYGIEIYDKGLPARYPAIAPLTLHNAAVNIRTLPSTLVFSNLTFSADCVSGFCWFSN
jgi:hypothetical protein